MDYTLISICFGILGVICLTAIMMIIIANRHIDALTKNTSYIQDMIIKMQNTLKNKSATNAVAEHAEMIYQDLLQNLIPILAALDIRPRNTS